MAITLQSILVGNTNTSVIVAGELIANESFSNSTSISIAVDYTLQINTIITHLSNISANVADINANVASITANVADINANVASIAANVESIRDDINNLQANVATITLVGTVDNPSQSNGFITRSRYEDYNNIAFLRYIMDPSTNFRNFPTSFNDQQQNALNSIPSWLTAANTYLPPRD